MVTEPTRTWVSSGGVSVSLTEPWKETRSDEDLAYWVRDESGLLFLPVLTVGVVPGRLERDAWRTVWVESISGLVVASEELAAGFEARYLWLASSRLVSTQCRIIWIPGRTVQVTVTFAYIDEPAYRREVSDILESVNVEGSNP